MAKRCADLIEPERLELVAQATYQVEGLLNALLKSAKDTDSDELRFLIQGMVPRLLTINSVVMSAAGDELESTEDLALRLAQ